MFKKSILITILGIITHQSWAIDAERVNINVTGTIKAAPCKLVGDETQTISLGTNILATELAEPGSTTEWKDISLQLTDCPTSTTKVKVSFSGSPSELDVTRLYSNSVGDKYAKNIEIELESKNEHKGLGNGENMLVDVNNSTHDVEFQLQTRLISTNGNATPGDILGTIVATFTYQ